MGAALAETALVEGEFTSSPGFGAKRGIALDPVVQGRLAAVPPRQCDVGVVGATLRLKASQLANALYLASQRFDFLLRPYSCPKRAAPAMIEAADPADGQLNWWKGDGREYGRKIIGKRPLDFPDEAQCQVQLLVVLPPEIHTFHYVDQSIADRFGRTNGDEEARHWLSFLR